MRTVGIVPVVVLALPLVVAVVAPIGPMSGSCIGRTWTTALERGRDTSDVHEIRLRVPGTLPRVVVIWVIEHGGELHVVGSRESGWVRTIGSGFPWRCGRATTPTH